MKPSQSHHTLTTTLPTPEMCGCVMPCSASAGGNGIASALPVFQELVEAGVKTQGLPALLLWPCRKGHEFTFMAARVMAAARALGLSLTIQLHITGGSSGHGLIDRGPSFLRLEASLL